MFGASRTGPRARTYSRGDELQALRRLERESKPSPSVFVSERGTPFTTAGFARMVERAARRGLGLELKAHPHMLRHACGYALANKGTIRGLFKDGCRAVIGLINQ